jgi:hypothetical protein
MNPLLLIQAVAALVELAPKGASLYQQVHALLSASDEPGAKEALAKLEATYAESAATRDAAIDAALAKTS